MDNHKDGVPSGTPHQKLILLVEDDTVMATLLIDIITDEMPCRIVWARNVMEVWQLVEGRRPDLLLLDYMLPGIHGLTIYDLLRTVPGWEAIPALILSAGPYRAEAEQRRIPFLAKPFVVDELLAQIYQLLKV